MKEGKLVVSLDFELLWGVFDKVDWREKIEYFQNTRELIPQILQLFQKYKISCTWATVGMLFNENWDEWNSNIPSFLPDYQNEKLSAYRYGRSIQSKKTEKLCFAPDMIQQIRNTEFQEIGTHTYSHYYCLEPGQTLETFKTDLQKSIEMASKFNLNLQSLVFPRNQFNERYLGICADLGLVNIRSNPNNWYWKNTQKDSLLQKVFRTGDAYLGFNNNSYSQKEIMNSNGIKTQKASRLLRPYSSGSLNSLKLRRIFSEMQTAAKKGGIYHLWWHPHNFGQNPHESILELTSVIMHFNKLRNNYGFQSKSMEDIDFNY